MRLVGMVMGDQDPIQPADTRGQQLLAHVGRGVDQHAGLAICDSRAHQEEQRPRRFFGLAGSQAPQKGWRPSPRRGTPPEEPQPRMRTSSM